MVVVAGARLDGPLDPDALAEADLLVAADGGADALLAAGMRPGLLVGDMDSIRPETLEQMRDEGVEVSLLPTAKDETDLETALRTAVNRGADRITVFGALGGPRLDHLLGTLLLLTAPWLQGRRVRLVDPWHEVFLAEGDVEIRGSPGDTVSLLPLSPVVRDVSTKGLLYSLEGEELHQSTTRGVSNALRAETARVTHGEGHLLVVHYRGRTEPAIHFDEPSQR
ncbi:MAG: thiamine diphosphokinase [Thermoleophilia bacterium]